MGVWSDGNRSRGLALAAVLLLVPMAHWCWERWTVGIGYGRIIADPVASDGAEFVLSLFTVTEVIDEGHYRATKGTDRFVVNGLSEGLTAGETLSIGATWVAADRSVDERWRETHPFRARKKLLGFAAIGFVAVAMPFWFRRRDGLIEVRDG